MVYAGILAAGIGSRMHRQDLPKQFLPLGEKPLIINTLEQFYVNPNIDKIIVVAPHDWHQFTKDMISKSDTMDTDVLVISGGLNKTMSVKLIVDYIEKNYGIGDDDILVTHDAVRPFVTQRIINENITAAREYGIAGTVVLTNDTIVASTQKDYITAVPKKSEMFAEQTPQTYRLKDLDSIFVQAEKENDVLESETELARLCIKQGRKIKMVRGDVSNMKIINPYDLEVANALLAEKKL
ncbi:MAG: 2-C-methyl-D-erythritol 4-phosphate cytidylyltransferase [Oscillospiraceae bacterium]